jgi:hypothetical protein
MGTAIYTNGAYLTNNPSWHSEDSPYKALQVAKMLARRGLTPECICEVGCGAGRILRTLHDSMPGTCHFDGYEVSPQAFGLASNSRVPRIQFFCESLPPPGTPTYDLVLIMDVIEHIEDYFTFLRQIKGVGVFKLLHVPLDVTAQGAVRNSLSRGWDDVGHIHSFTKDVALKAITHCGYDIVDYFYTSRSELPSNNWALRAAGVPRRLAFAIHPDLAVRLLGGYSLLILAK